MFSLQKRLISLFILSSGLIFSCNQGKKIENSPKSNIKIDSLNQLISKYPDSIQLQIALQEALYIKGDTSSALSNLLMLTKKFPKAEALHNAIGIIYLQKGDTLKATEAIIHSLSINQNQPDIEFELAFLQAAQKNKTALITANHIINRYKEKEIQAKGHYARGIYFANLALPKQAIMELDSAIIKHFTMVDAYVEKAILLLEGNNPSLAIETLDKAVALDKKNTDILYWLGKAYQQKKEYDKALLYFSETLNQDPSYAPAVEAIKEIKK